MYYLGIASTIFIIVTCGYLVYRVEGSGALTVSQHAAMSKKASRYFAITLIIGTTSYDLWMIYYLVPKLHLADYWIALIVLAIVCDWTLSLVPVTTRMKKIVHNTAAYIAGVLSILLVGAIVVNQFTSQITHILAILSLLGMFVLIAIAVAALKLPVLAKNALALEVLFMGFFFVATLAATYL